MLDITEEVLPDKVVFLKLSGIADEDSVKRIMAYFSWLLARDINRIIVDLNATSGDIMQLAKAVLASRWMSRRTGGNVIVVCEHATLRKHLESAGISGLFNSVDLALDSLQPTPSHDRPHEIFNSNP